MSISDEIAKLQDNLEDSYTAVENKGGTLPQNQCFDNLPNAIGSITELKGETRSVSLTDSSGQTFTPSSNKNGITSITVTPNNQAKTITPTTSQQTIGIESGYSGNGTITVNAVDSTIDSDISAANIVLGKNILGVDGSAIVLNGETKSVSLTNSAGQTFTPSSDKNAITSITVTPNNQARTVTPTTSQQTIGIGSGYSGNGTITVDAVDATIDSNIQSQYIKNGITILNVEGSLEEGITPSGTINISNNGTVDVTNYASANVAVDTINNTSLAITPSTSAQSFSPSSPYTGYDPVTISAVTASIDSNIAAANIVSGKSILGVNGSATVLNGETRNVSITSSSGNTFTPTTGKNGITSITVTPTNQARTVTPTTSQQTIGIGSGYSGNGTITVNAVTSDIDSNIAAANIVSGKSILGVNGSATILNGETKSVSLTNSAGQTFTPSSNKNAITSITVTPNNQARTVTPTTSQQSLTINSGYSGNGTITVNAVNSSIDQNIVANKIKKDVVILGVTGSYEGEGANIDSLNVTPTTSAQTITASGNVDGYSPVNVSAVTSSIDPNITPNKIRKGVNILGVTGTYGDVYIEPLKIIQGNVSWYRNNNYDLYGCGLNNQGQQGSGNTTNVTTFTKRAENVKDFFTDGSITGYINFDNELFLCGRNSSGAQGNGTSGSGTNVTTFTKRAENVKKGAINSDKSLYITNTGDLYGCGSGAYSNVPMLINNQTAKVTTFTKIAENVKDIDWSLNGLGLYITTDDSLYGIGFVINKSSYTLLFSDIKQYAIKYNTGNSTYEYWFIDNNDNLYGYGASNGIDSRFNADYVTLVATNVKKVLATDNTQAGYLTNTGDLYLAGTNNYGQQGSGDTYTVGTFTKRAENVKDFWMKSSNTFYVTNNNILYGCGYNGNYSLATGNNTNSSVFIQIATNVKEFISPNLYIDNDDILYGWGENYIGQLGTGDTSYVKTVTQIATNVKKAYNTGGNIFYVTYEDEIYRSGNNSYGQLGTGNTSNLLVFTKLILN